MKIPFVEFVHELLVIWIVVVLKLSIFNGETVLIEGDFAYISVFGFLLLFEFIRGSMIRQELLRVFLGFFHETLDIGVDDSHATFLSTGVRLSVLAFGFVLVGFWVRVEVPFFMSPIVRRFMVVI